MQTMKLKCNACACLLSILLEKVAKEITKN